MKRFGEQSDFAFEYDFDSSDTTVGRLSVWIDGKNICEYNKNNEFYLCNCNLLYLVDWFAEKVELILGYDPFPLPVCGSSAIELLKAADLYDNNNMLEFDLWYDAKSRWIFNHCWFSARDGFTLPCVYFRRVDTCIEISIDNNFWLEERCRFSELERTYYIPMELFVQVLRMFLSAVLIDIEVQMKNADITSKIRRRLDILDIV